MRLKLLRVQRHLKFLLSFPKKTFNLHLLEIILKENNLEVEDDISDDLHKEALTQAKKYILKYFGKLDILLGDLQRHTRGEKDLPVSGMIDMIAPSYVVDYKDGRLRSVSGESYIMLVKYGKDDLEIETILPYGNSNNKDSSHYTDQMEMFQNFQLKTIPFNRKEVLKNASKIYRPK